MSIGTFERMSKTQVAADVAMGYERLRGEGKVPADHSALFDGLFEVSQSPDASVWAVLLCRVAVIDALGDGTLSSSEIEEAQAVTSFLASGTGISEAQLRRFADEHPTLKELLRERLELIRPED